MSGSEARVNQHYKPSMQGVRISSTSVWEDNRWTLDNQTAGSRKTMSTIIWNFEVGVYKQFTDPLYAELLESFKHFVWSLFSDRRYGRNLKPNNLRDIGHGARYLASWMIDQGFSRFDQLRAGVWPVYLADLEQKALSEDRPQSWIYGRVGIVSRLFEQGQALDDVGVSSIPDIPFEGRPATEVAKAILEDSIDPTLPIPDAVSLPIMTAAFRMIGEPAKDVTRLLAEYINFRELNETPEGRLLFRYQSKPFKFSTVAGELKPWHPTVAPTELFKRYEQPRLQHDRGETEMLFPEKVLLSDLLRTIVGAAAIVLQSGTGLRSSEMLGLVSGLNPQTGLPVCIEVRRSNGGYNDVFYLKGKTYKISRTADDAEWLCGMRPVGSTYLPPTVQAILALEHLLAPFRIEKNQQALFTLPDIVFGWISLIPKSAKLIDTTRFSNLQRHFISNCTTIEWNALPNDDQHRDYAERGAAAVRAMNWRKTWAHFMFAVDLSSVPLIAQQFQHMSLAMTEQSYLGNDPSLLTTVQETQTDLTVSALYEFAQGKRLLIGRFAGILEDHRAMLEQLTIGVEQEEGEKRIRHFAIDNDLTLWFQNSGKCAIRCTPMHAKCHQIAGTLSSENVAPNWTVKSTSICLSCACFFTDYQHSNFWLHRYINLRRTLLQTPTTSNAIKLYQDRSKQAAAMLKVFNITIPSDSEVINET